MSDFFAALHSQIDKPDVVMNSGPLPPQSGAGMPVGFNGIPDGRIGGTASLLGDVQPYSYGGPARLSTQTAYLNIPHVTQRLIPSLSIPKPYPGTGMMQLNHQIDDGDIAFVVRCMFSPYELVENKKKFGRQGVLHAIDPVINIATVNYLLHGLQRYGYHAIHKEWHTLWIALGLQERFSAIDARLVTLEAAYNADLMLPETDARKQTMRKNRVEKKAYNELIAHHIIKNVITPFGVPRGSEKQGGQHQGLVNKSVTWPVDLVTSMVVDGRVINLVNFWKDSDINAGDDLVLYLAENTNRNYTLSHHPKSVCQYIFQEMDPQVLPDPDVYNQSNTPRLHVSEVADIVSQIDKICKDADRTTGIVNVNMNTLGIFQLMTGVSSSSLDAVQNAIWNKGYWHIARSQVMQFKHDNPGKICSDATATTSGKLIQATFEPTWIDPLETSRSKRARHVQKTYIHKNLAHNAMENGTTFMTDMTTPMETYIANHIVDINERMASATSAENSKFLQCVQTPENHIGVCTDLLNIFFADHNIHIALDRYVKATMQNIEENLVTLNKTSPLENGLYSTARAEQKKKYGEFIKGFMEMFMALFQKYNDVNAATIPVGTSITTAMQKIKIDSSMFMLVFDDNIYYPSNEWFTTVCQMAYQSATNEKIFLISDLLLQVIIWNQHEKGNPADGVAWLQTVNGYTPYSHPDRLKYRLEQYYDLAIPSATATDATTTAATAAAAAGGGGAAGGGARRGGGAGIAPRAAMENSFPALDDTTSLNASNAPTSLETGSSMSQASTEPTATNTPSIAVAMHTKKSFKKVNAQNI
jgi:hypothetical protein